MEQVLAGVVTGVAVLVSAALTARITGRVSRVDREEREKSELSKALAAYGAAVDRLDVKISQLPPRPGRLSRPLSDLLAKWKDLDWLLGRVVMATFGRSTMKAVDELIYASNHLALVAPESLLPEIEAIGRLLERVEVRDGQWSDDWRTARQNLAQASRRALHPAGS